MAEQRRYGKVSEDTALRLAGIVGEANVLTGEDRENYARDEAPGAARAVPELVLRPGNTREVAAVLKVANEARIPVIVRGAGTGLSGGGQTSVTVSASSRPLRRTRTS